MNHRFIDAGRALTRCAASATRCGCQRVANTRPTRGGQACTHSGKPGPPLTSDPFTAPAALLTVPRGSISSSSLTASSAAGTPWPSPRPARHLPEHERQSRLLGQCADGERLTYAQDRARASLRLSDLRRSPLEPVQMLELFHERKRRHSILNYQAPLKSEAMHL